MCTLLAAVTPLRGWSEEEGGRVSESVYVFVCVVAPFTCWGVKNIIHVPIHLLLLITYAHEHHTSTGDTHTQTHRHTRTHLQARASYLWQRARGGGGVDVMAASPP